MVGGIASDTTLRLSLHAAAPRDIAQTDASSINARRKFRLIELNVTLPVGVTHATFRPCDCVCSVSMIALPLRKLMCHRKEWVDLLGIDSGLTQGPTQGRGSAASQVGGGLGKKPSRSPWIFAHRGREARRSS